MSGAEEDRVRAELKRVQAESDRVDAEGQKIKGEYEGDRRTAESGRSEAEFERVRAETRREDQFQNRSTAETGRTEAETGRTDAETGRESAEKRREGLYAMPAWVPQSRRSAIAAAFCLLLAFGVPSGLISYELSSAANNSDNAQIRTAIADIEKTQAEVQRQAHKSIKTRIAICEQIEADRVDNARAWTQAESTWTDISQDPTITASARANAGVTALVYAESANQLRKRLFKCEPLVKRGDEIIDENALREAKGNL